MDSLNITLIGEMLTFAVLIWFTMKFIWPPIIQTINERQKQIADGIAAAERGHHDLGLAQQQAAKIIQEAQKKASSIIEQAEWEVVSIVEHGKVKAKEENERLLLLGRADIEQEKLAAKQLLQQQTAAIAIMAIEKILRAKIDSATNKQLVEQLLSEIK